MSGDLACVQEFHAVVSVENKSQVRLIREISYDKETNIKVRPF